VQFFVRRGTFRCPSCGELLKYTRENVWFVLPTSIALAIALAFFLGYRGPVLGLITVCAAPVFFFLGISVAFHVHPPGVQQSLSNGDVGFRFRR
jgi:hypothetical protein